jgi:hypothetical protein
MMVHRVALRKYSLLGMGAHKLPIVLKSDNQEMINFSEITKLSKHSKLRITDFLPLSII